MWPVAVAAAPPGDRQVPTGARRKVSRDRRQSCTRTQLCQLIRAVGQNRQESLVVTRINKEEAVRLESLDGLALGNGGDVSRVSLDVRLLPLDRVEHA